MTTPARRPGRPARRRSNRRPSAGPAAAAFRYILRYQVDPCFAAEDRIAELVDLCRRSRIEEVMLFLFAEELSTGHPTDAEADAWIAMARRLRDALARVGVQLSLNPWCTVYHAARGRRLQPGQAFTRMVGETGAESPVAVCPLCPAWQDYIAAFFARLAREIEPVALWIEDDFRLHNHDEVLGFGGCFCDRHLARMGEKVGQPVTREQILSAMLAPGPPHPWRQAWLDLSRESILEPLRRVADAVRAASPSVRLGLMSSMPDVHSIEGRRWEQWADVLGRPLLLRPHLPPYTETPPLSTPPVIARQTIACIDGPVEIYPELENSPRCGPYSKSAAYSIWECFESAIFGARGITINHFDMMGNGTGLDPAFGPALAAARPRLDALAALGLSDRNAEGVRVLFSTEAAAHTHLAAPAQSLKALSAGSDVWASTLSILGIAHGFARDVEPGARQPVAVGGATLWAFSDEQIRAMLSGPVLLDALSAEILVARGFGPRIGIASASWAPLEQTGYGYEEILEDDPAVYGIARPRMTASRCATRLLGIEPTGGAQVRTNICGPDRAALFPGCVVHRSDLGGTIAVLAYPFDGRHQFFMGFFNVFRRRLLQRLVFELAPRARLACAGDPVVHLYRLSMGRETFLAAFNPTYDRAKRIDLRVESALARRRFRMLTPDGRFRPARVRVTPQGRTSLLSIPIDLAPLDGVFLLTEPG